MVVCGKSEKLVMVNTCEALLPMAGSSTGDTVRAQSCRVRVTSLVETVLSVLVAVAVRL